MKKKKLMMLLLLLMLSMVVSKPAWAETVTIDLTSTEGLDVTSYGNSTYSENVSIYKDGITISSDGGYYDTGWAQCRLKIGLQKIFMITSNIGNITQIDVTFQTENDASQLSNYSNSGKIATRVVSPSALSWTATAKSQGIDIRQVVVTYTPATVYTLSSSVSPAAAGTVQLGAATVAEGSTTNISATANTGYRFTSWSVTGTGSSVTNASAASTTFTMGTANATVTANFEAIPTHTVTWSVNGVTSTEEVSEGADITFNEPASNVPAGYTFRGWSATEILTPQNDEPTLVTSATMNTSDITYYAVFAIDTKTCEWHKKSASQVTEVGTYAIITSDGYAFDGTLTNNNGNLTASAFSFTNNVATSAPSGTCELSFIKVADGHFKIHHATKGYLYISDTGTQKLGWKNNENYYWYTDGTIWIYSKDNNYLRDYHTENNRFFRTSTTASESYSPIYFAKKKNIYINYCTQATPIAMVTLAAACTDGVKYYGTYSNASAFVVPSDLTVSEIKVVDGKLAVSNYTTGDVVPANTGVMVASTTAGNHFVDLTNAAGSSVLGEENMLKPSGSGITAEGMASGNDGKTFYRLTMHNGSTLGFYWGAENGAAFALDANKAFLAVPSGAGARISGFNFDDQTSGIKTMNNASTISHEAYNLQGQRVKADRKGLIVRNGKIIMNK